MSSSTSSPQFSTSSKSAAETRSEDAWALSLDVLEPVPLNIHNPSLRRSSRSTTNRYRTPNSKRSESGGRSRALTASQFRWSPRLSSHSSALALNLGDGGNASSAERDSKQRCRSLEDKEAGARVGKRRKLGSGDVILRRSLRLSGGKISDYNLQLLALPEPGSRYGHKGVLSEKCLRSRTVLISLQDDKPKVEKVYRRRNGPDLGKNRLIECYLNESPEVSGNGVVRSVSEGSDFTEKCSRLCAMKDELEKCASENGVGDCCINSPGGIDFVLNGFPKPLEMRSGSSSLSGFPRLNLDEMVDLPEKSPSTKEKPLSLRPSTVEKQLPKERADTVASVKNVSTVKSKSSKKGIIPPKIESASDERPNVSERWDKERRDLELRNEKCLRSGETQFEVNVDETAKETSDPVERRHASKDHSVSTRSVKSREEKVVECCFVGEPVPEEVAQNRWQWRYELKSKNKDRGRKLNADEEDEIILNVNSHYEYAKVGDCLLELGDCVYVKGEGTKKYVGRILEFFKTTDGEDYFRVQWFFRAEDTVLKDVVSSHDKRRLFYSTLMNDNLLDCIIKKVNIERVPPTLCPKSTSISADFYYDMEYSVDYSTFRTLDRVAERFSESEAFLMSSKHLDEKPISVTPLSVVLPDSKSSKDISLLDLYSGCGGMSTGLCVGAKLSSAKLVTKWAVDYSSSACDSLKLNHPKTQVRNEAAEDFLELLKQWKQLCKMHACDLEGTIKCVSEDPPETEATCITKPATEDSSEEYEVSDLLDICFGDPNRSGSCGHGLHFKVRWKGYDSDEDTWEPIEGLSNCQERIKEFVMKGYQSKILPLPGDVDVICGGPPCQGISGYNRYRNFDSPLADERNRQIVVFMDIVEFLKPKYVLMENVVDIIRFDKGSLGRYALSRLVLMKYQARLGTMASGCYGLPQFRLRVFIWGAHPAQKLPQFPLPTHDVVVKYWPPSEFERNTVAYEEGQPRSLEEAIVLRDSISDLPSVSNDELCDEIKFDKPPETEFQAYIRLSKDEIMSSGDPPPTVSILYDHRPLQLSEHDYLRVRQIPRRKGANFRDLAGVVVGEDNVARRDPTKEPVMLPTGKLLVPDCVFTWDQGKSKRPYGRLWWDETVSTIVTLPYIRNQAILHPEQDRCLTIRECARLQGFPDYYRLCGSVKDRYRQVGNAVSIPVARALGYALGMAYQKVIGDGPLMTLPPKFSTLRPASSD